MKAPVLALARVWRRAFEKYQALGTELEDLPFDNQTELFLLDRWYHREQQIAEKFERLYPSVDLWEAAHDPRQPAIYQVHYWREQLKRDAS